jgi:histidine triad (HIT) family protein
LAHATRAADDGSCAFCAIARGETPAATVLDTPNVLAFLDRRPVFKGHTLVVPRAHVATLADLERPLLEELFGRVQEVAAAVRTGTGAAGTFVALNDVVSQSVPHVHVHVVPRTRGDGLRGFFWPRLRYEDDEEMAAYAEAIRLALGATT